MLENDAFSMPEFGEFAKRVVLFTHVTTHVKTDPYQLMLSEMGFNAFPSVAVLDAEGRFVEGHVGGDKLAGLASMVDKAETYHKDVIAKADAGDKAAQKQFFLDRVERGGIPLAAAKEGLDKMTDLTPKERDQVNGKLPALEMNVISGTAWMDRPAATKKYVAMFKAGRVPAGQQDGSRLLNIVLGAAEADQDLPLFKDAAAKLKALVADGPRGKQQVEAIDKRLQKLEAGAKDK